MTVRYEIIDDATITDFSGERFCPIINPRGAWHALWALGTDYKSLYSDNPLVDFAGSGETLSGGAVGANTFHALAGSTLDTGVAGDDLAEDFDEATLVVVARAGDVNPQNLMGNWDGSGVLVGMMIGLDASGAKAWHFTGAGTLEIGLGADADCDTAYTMYAASFTRGGLSVYRRRSSLNNGKSSFASLPHDDYAIGGPGNIFIGPHVGFADTDATMAFAGLAKKALSQYELDQVYTDLKAALAPHAIVL